MIKVPIAPGQYIDVDTDDAVEAQRIVDDYLKKNPDLVPKTEAPVEEAPVEETRVEEAPVEEAQTTETEEDVNLFGDFGVGLTRGLIKAGQGIAELGTSAIDLAADTKYTRDVGETFEGIEKQYNLKPKSLAGEVGSIIGNYVIPGVAAIPLGAAAGTAAAARLGVTAFRPIVKTVGSLFGIGLTDAVVAPSGQTTIGDVVDVGPTKTTEIKDSMSGREQALATLANKAKVGAEAVVAAPIAGAALKSAGVVAKAGLEAASTAAAPVVAPLAKPLQSIVERTAKFADEAQFSDQECVRKLDDYVFSNLRVRGKLPADVAKNVELAGAEAKAVNEELSGTLVQLEREMGKLQKPLQAIFSARTRTANQDLTDRVTDALTGGSRKIAEKQSEIDFLKAKEAPRARIEAAEKELELVKKTAGKESLDALEEPLRAPVMAARLQIDNLSRKMLNIDSIQKKYSKDVGREFNILSEKIAADQAAGRTVSPEDIRRAQFLEAESRVPTILDPKIPDLENAESVRGIVSDQIGRYLTRVHRRVEERNFDIPDSELSKMAKEISRSTGQSINASKAQIEKYAKEIGSDITTDTKVVGGRKVPKVVVNTGILQPRRIKDEPVPDIMSKVLGEVTDPKVRYASTVKKMSNLIASDNFYRNFVRQGLDDGSISTLPKQNKFGEDYVQMNGPRYGVLGTGNDVGGKGTSTGFFVEPDIAKGLERTSYRGGTGLIPLYLSTFGRLKGASQFAKTVLSVPTQVRNFGSGPIFMIMQGNVGPGKDVLEAASLIGTVIRNNSTIGPDTIARGLSARNMKKLFELDEAGKLKTETREVLDENGERILVGTDDAGTKFYATEKVPKVTPAGEEYLNAIRDVQRSQELGLIGTSVKANEMSANLERDFGAGKLYDALNKGTGNIMKFAETLYRSSDDLFKIAMFRAERAKYQQAFPNRSIKEIEELAAENVKNVMPTYPRVVQAAAALRAAPLGSFVSYQAEIIRNTANTLRLGLKEIAQGQAENNPELRRIGTQRLIGLSTAMYVIPQTLYETGKILSGVSEEQMRALQASGVDAEWSKGTTKMPTKVEKTSDGNVILKFVDLSFSLPLDPLRRPFERIIREFNEGAIKEEDIDKRIFDALSGAGNELFKSFTEEAIITEGLVDVTFRGGRTKEGRIIYRDSDDVEQKTAKIISHLSRTLLPTTAELFVKPGYAPENLTNIGIQKGALAKALDKDIPEYGKPNILSEQLAGVLTGAKEQTFDFGQGLQFSAQEYGFAYREQAPNRIRALRRGGSEVTQERFESEYRQSLENAYRAAQQIATDVEAARLWGVSERVIRKSLKKMPGAREIMRNQFKPPPAVTGALRDIIREHRRNKTLGFDPDLRRLREIEREFRRKPLVDKDAFKKPESVPRRAFEGVRELVTPSPAQSAPIERPRNRMPPPPPPPAPVQTQPPPGPRTNVNPILVPNPVTRGTFGQQ